MTDGLAASRATIPVLDPLPLHLSPEALKLRLAAMIRFAVAQGSAAVADTVVRYFQALAVHPALEADAAERAAYCHGAQHWRRLAAVGERVAG
jgi:hypothetical protein